MDSLRIDGFRELAEDTSQRTRDRDSLLLIATMRLEKETMPQSVRVRNLSAGGLMVESGRPLGVDARVVLELRGIGKVTGRVAWYVEGRAGIALDKPIDPKRARKPVSGAKTKD